MKQGCEAWRTGSSELMIESRVRSSQTTSALLWYPAVHIRPIATLLQVLEAGGCRRRAPPPQACFPSGAHMSTLPEIKPTATTSCVG